MWGSNEGCAWMSLGGVGHVELNVGFFGLTRWNGFSPKVKIKWS